MPVVPIITTDWSLIRNFRPGDFNHPEKLDFRVVRGVDLLSSILGEEFIILDDFRIFSKIKDSQHLLGRAIDFTVPTVEPMTVLDTIRKIKWFSGYGMYVNERGIVSFHVDTRTDRSPDNPATWGASKGREINQREWAYTSLRSIIDKYFPAALPALVWVFIMGVGIYCLAEYT